MAENGTTPRLSCIAPVVGPDYASEGRYHYADLCGIKERYEEKQFRVSGGVSAKGTYVVSDRASSLTIKAESALSVFLLRTGRYTVTATIQPDPDGKAMRGSIVATIP
jgi:hypothetical protein